MPGPEQPVENDQPTEADRSPADPGTDRSPADPGTDPEPVAAGSTDPRDETDADSVRDDAREPSQTAPGEESTDESAPTDWWDDPRMPWKGKPSRNDILCWAGISLSGIIGLIMIPLRPVLLGSAPLALVAISGSRSGLVTSGALGDVGRADWWPIALVVGIISAMKWDPLFWWAGRLWGPGLIDMMASRSRWARMNAERAERFARKYAVPAVLLTYVLPIPAAVVYGTVGMAGMRLRTFLISTLAGSAVVCSLWVYLGFRLGQRAVDVVDVIARYSGYIALALVAVIVINAVWRGRAGARA